MREQAKNLQYASFYHKEETKAIEMQFTCVLYKLRGDRTGGGGKGQGSGGE